ncbi:nuclear poly(A) polymerase 3 [Rutidosis leptorrhynchoides]|uniref:nuclear poly(A) polymerase 3 n=1 Tax=Rutidosis leptorrhynchoides TaxID=125765 RepID=UPI003A999792
MSESELENSSSLLKFLSDEGLVASPEEELRRRKVVDKLNEILRTWIKRVAFQRRLPQNSIKDASVTILPYGSYGLDVYNADSNIDIICVGPCFASIAEDFFIVLYNMLAGRPEVSGMNCVKDAKTPLLQFTFEGILINLPLAKLQVTTVPENLDIFNLSLSKDIDEISWTTLSGVRVKNSILQLVPDVARFRELLYCVKSWAKRRGLYSDLFGYFRGIHLTVLTAFVCLQNPSASLVNLLSTFFKTFALWPWPEPVAIQGATPPPLPPGIRSMMNIQLPGSPHEYCHSNITTSTFNKIRSEFRRGHRQTQDPLRSQFDWRNLFETFPYSKTYLNFIKICISSYEKDELGIWVQWVKSHIRSLLIKLEELHALCDPNPTEYIDISIRVPNVVFYWGLVPGRGDNLDLNFATQFFMNKLGIGFPGNMGRLTLTMVQSSQLPKKLDLADDHIKEQLKTNLSYEQRKVPVYSAHSPDYVVGYLACNGDTGDAQYDNSVY